VAAIKKSSSAKAKGTRIRIPERRREQREEGGRREGRRREEGGREGWDV
jgi:hypothetical protein